MDLRQLNDLSFYVEEGEIRVIIGPNGAGKTTVLDLDLWTHQIHRGFDQVLR